MLDKNNVELNIGDTVAVKQKLGFITIDVEATIIAFEENKVRVSFNNRELSLSNKSLKKL